MKDQEAHGYFGGEVSSTEGNKIIFMKPFLSLLGIDLKDLDPDEVLGEKFSGGNGCWSLLRIKQVEHWAGMNSISNSETCL